MRRHSDVVEPARRYAKMLRDADRRVGPSEKLLT